MMKTSSRQRVALRPSASSACSFSRTARRTRPCGEYTTAYIIAPTATTTAAQNATNIHPCVSLLIPESPLIGLAINDSPAAPFTSPVFAVTTIVATTETTSITIAW